ncbi:hypothetical protein GCM10010168_52970 [Actinoplanes ianthinogenes]|uniref:RNA polymerase sigma-70 region 2 domain-containing protein n=1 Tax=Actinoplanes ianthinogenes TaxID=122358 RepID=A0ABM7LR22_9ACTN|nr:sigma factor [Actinoplanes ianthinogenes]BCJ41705.1 hypothetical protein Aiant_23620 [Actinoplanes ianthinogenes]GGR28291.1 hypothetical protein GCM10010168_52970 [Actinoplanes ianthinogenes]
MTVDLTPFAQVDIGQARAWLKGFSRRIAPSTISADDLEAEGLIAMWQAYEKRGNDGRNLDSYLIQAAKWQILQVLDRRKWTGQDKTRAPRGRNSPGHVIHADQVEQLHPDHVMANWDEAAADAAGYCAAELADVRSQVRDALAFLPPSHRDRLFRKFWLDESVPLAGGWWGSPNYGARTRLRAQLAHLQHFAA